MTIQRSKWDHFGIHKSHISGSKRGFKRRDQILDFISERCLSLFKIKKQQK